jgi:hypothetical protein
LRSEKNCRSKGASSKLQSPHLTSDHDRRLARLNHMKLTTSRIGLHKSNVRLRNKTCDVLDFRYSRLAPMHLRRNPQSSPCPAPRLRQRPRLVPVSAQQRPTPSHSLRDSPRRACCGRLWRRHPCWRGQTLSFRPAASQSPFWPFRCSGPVSERIQAPTHIPLSFCGPGHPSKTQFFP